MDGDALNVLYYQMGTFLGDRPGDPITEPHRVFVERIYENGKPFLMGRAADYNKDKLPPE